MPASPPAAEPRKRLKRNVSTWSSACCARTRRGHSWVVRVERGEKEPGRPCGGAVRGVSVLISAPLALETQTHPPRLKIEKIRPTRNLEVSVFPRSPNFYVVIFSQSAEHTSDRTSPA